MRKISVSKIISSYSLLSLVCVSGGIFAEAVVAQTSSESQIGSERAAIRYTGSSAGSTGFTSFKTLFPLFQNSNSFTYINPQVNIFDNGRLGSNLVVGHRFFNGDSNMIFGGYLAYDNRDSGNAFFNQIGLGLEAIAESWDLKANAYLPVGNVQRFVSTTGIGTFSGSQLYRTSLYDTAMTVIDLEAGGIVKTGTDDYLRPALATYYLSAPSSSSALGIRGSLTYNSDLVTAGLSLQNDSIFGTRLQFNVGLNFAPDKSTRRTTDVLRRIDEFPTRNNAIVVQNQLVADASPVINPTTGQPYQFFVVSDTPDDNVKNANIFSSSQFSSALALAAAQVQNGVVYFYTKSGSTAPAISGFTIADGVKVISSAPSSIPLTDQNSGIPIPLTVGTGVYPSVNGTVTLASGSNQIISGYDIRPHSPGIIGTNNVNATIVDNRVAVTTSVGNDHDIFLSGFSGNTNVLRNTVSNSIGAGILLQNGSGNATVSNNNVTITAPNTSLGFKGRGIVLSSVNATTTTIDGNTVSGAIGEEIRFDNVTGNAAITNNTVLNTIQPRTQTELEASIFVRLGAGNINLNISGNRVDGNSTLSTFRSNGLPLVTNEIDGIEVSVCRFYPDSIGGCSATTTATVNITGNTITNITGSNDGADGIDINLANRANSTLTITGNTIDNIVNKGISFGAVDGSVGTTTIANNNISNVGGAAIQVRVGETAVGGQPSVRAAVLNNKVTNTNTQVGIDDASMILRSQSAANLCVRFEGNTLNNPTSTLDYLFRRQSTSASGLQLAGLTTAIAVLAPPIDATTIAALNNPLRLELETRGNTGNRFRVQNNTVQIPTAACTFP